MSKEKIKVISNSDKLSFTKREVKKYLDNCIDFWRKERDENQNPIAKYYIDAFQSVRTSIFGSIKKKY